MPGDDEARAARAVTGRAIRRLGLLETVLTLAAAVVALVAGALTAVLLREAAGLPFRATWIVASVVYFAVPAGVTMVRSRREESERLRSPSSPSPPHPD